MCGPLLPFFFLLFDTKAPLSRHPRNNRAIFTKHRNPALVINIEPFLPLFFDRVLSVPGPDRHYHRDASPPNFSVRGTRFLCKCLGLAIHQSVQNTRAASRPAPSAPHHPCFPTVSTCWKEVQVPIAVLAVGAPGSQPHQADSTLLFLSALSPSLGSFAPHPLTLPASHFSPDRPPLIPSRSQHGPEFSTRQLTSPVSRRGKREGGLAFFEVPDDSPPTHSLPVSATPISADDG